MFIFSCTCTKFKSLVWGCFVPQREDTLVFLNKSISACKLHFKHNAYHSLCHLSEYPFFKNYAEKCSIAHPIWSLQYTSKKTVFFEKVIIPFKKNLV